MANSIEIDLSDILDEQVQIAKEALEEAQKETADEVVKILKQTSPSGNSRTRKYKNSWKSKIEKGSLSSNVVIYNEKGSLTHLLENGHAIANQFGKYGGRTRAFPHIAPAEEKAKEILLQKIEEKMK